MSKKLVFVLMQAVNNFFIFKSFWVEIFIDNQLSLYAYNQVIQVVRHIHFTKKILKMTALLQRALKNFIIHFLEFDLPNPLGVKYAYLPNAGRA